MSEATIRPATADDLPAINDIYNHYVRNSTTTYQEDEETIEGRHAWFAGRSPMHPVRVMEVGGEVIGWSSLNVFRVRSAYRFTTENSLYLRHDRIGRGLGKLLLADQIELATTLGHHVIVAGIDSAQVGSIKLHERFGFERCGTMRETGLKFGRWLDVVFLQKMLAPRENRTIGDV
jgi:L-amino acid N-acyltransferase